MSYFQFKTLLQHLLVRTLFITGLLSFGSNVAVISLQVTIADNNDEPTYRLLQFAATTMEMHQHPAFPAISNQQLPIGKLDANTNGRLVDTFTRMVHANWSSGYLLLQLSELAEDLDFKVVVFEILYSSLQPTKKIYNPFELLEFYRRVATTSTKLCAEMDDWTQQKCSRIANVRSQLRQALTIRCAQILEGYAHLPQLSNSIHRSDVVRRILNELSYLQDDRIYAETMEHMFDAVQDLVPGEQLARSIGNFSVNAKQNMIANVQLLARLPSTTTTQNASNVVRTMLQENLRDLLKSFYSHELASEWRARVYAFLPASIRNLYLATKVCIRNATDASRYLYECPHTYLVCTNAKDLKKATFTVENKLKDVFAFRSLHWTNRYLCVENNTNLSEKRASIGFVKNVYSKENAHYWQAEWHGDNVALLDPSQNSYLCAGRGSATSDEDHAYTRPAEQYLNFLPECQWYIEDCSGI